MNRSFVLAFIVSAGGSVPLLSQTPSAAARRQVFAAESSFAASMAARDFEAFAAHVSPEAVFFGDTTVMRGKQAVLRTWRRFFEKPDAPFSWKAETVEVLPSGSLALSSGPVLDSKGSRVGTFSSVWRKESDGAWLIVFDKGCR